VAVGVAALQVQAQAYASVVQLSSLDGSTGFRLDGVTSFDQSGSSVSAAGDGVDDLLIGARGAGPQWRRLWLQLCGVWCQRYRRIFLCSGQN